MARIPYLDLGGGLNQGKPGSTINDNEMTALSNFYPFSTKLKRRGGHKKLNTTAAYTEQLTGIFPYRPDGATEVTTIVGGLTTLAKRDGTEIVAIPAEVDFSIGSSTKPWVMFEYKDIMYAFRESSNQLIRCDGSYYGAAGISAPATAPTIAEGAAGTIPAASFYGVFTYYNSATNVESNPSTASAELVHGGTKKIDWTGITISTNPQVDSRRLYRTLPNNTGEYYFVTQIDNNFDTTYTGDDVLVQDMGRSVSFFNGVPPTGLLFGTVWKERLFCSDGELVYYSEDGLIENFDETSFIPVFPDDGHEIRAIHAYGDRLVVGKTNKVHYLVGTDPAYFALLTLSDRHGCASHHSMQSAEGLLFWLGLDNVYRSDGNNVVGIASVKIEEILESLTAAQKATAIAAVYPALNWYVLVIPGVAELVYNYKTDAWAEMSTLSGISHVAENFDDDYLQELFTTDTAGNLYRFNDPDYDYDDDDTTLKNAITATFTTKDLDGGQQAAKAVMIRIHLLITQYQENITLDWIHGDSGNSINSREVSLDYESPWKTYALSTRRQARAHTRLKVTYTGVTTIEIQGFAIDREYTGRFATVAH
jgi:hypothetical protein